MKRKALNQLARDPRFIPGIYNYCDRWCERCTFTSRCRNYESTGTLSTEQLDINNKAFWDGISANFTKAIELISEKAKELGIESVVFDRGGNLYHGRVKAIADGAREGGLVF